MLMRALILMTLLAVLVLAPRMDSRGVEGGAQASAAGPQTLELAIIVNKANPIDNLSMAELREYFLAERGHWPEGRGKVRVVMLEPGRPEREAVLRLVYGMNEKGFNSYFLGKKFRGETLEEPRQQSSAPDVVKFISYVQGGIGYVRPDEVDASVKVIRVDGLAPGDAGYKLKQ